VYSIFTSGRISTTSGGGGWNLAAAGAAPVAPDCPTLVGPGAFIEESTAGRLDGFYLLGWGADYPHITNFLDFHFGAANPQFGVQSPTYYEPMVQGAQIADPAEAEPFYVEANNAIREFVPMIPVAHGGSGTAYRADVTNQQASPRDAS